MMPLRFGQAEYLHYEMPDPMRVNTAVKQLPGGQEAITAATQVLTDLKRATEALPPIGYS
jgi:hypothetical protein